MSFVSGDECVSDGKISVQCSGGSMMIPDKSVSGSSDSAVAVTVSWMRGSGVTVSVSGSGSVTTLVNWM